MALIEFFGIFKIELTRSILKNLRKTSISIKFQSRATRSTLKKCQIWHSLSFSKSSYTLDFEKPLKVGNSTLCYFWLSLKIRRPKDQKLTRQRVDLLKIRRSLKLQCFSFWGFDLFWRFLVFLKDFKKPSHLARVRPFFRVDWRGRNRRFFRNRRFLINSMSTIFQSRSRRPTLKFDTHRVFLEFSRIFLEKFWKTRWVPFFKAARVARLLKFDTHRVFWNFSEFFSENSEKLDECQI